MIKNNLSRLKKGGTTGIVVLSLALLTACSAPKNDSGAKILRIDNTKATKIVSMGTLTKNQIKKVEDLSNAEVKDSNVVTSSGTKVPQKQVKNVVEAINTGDKDKVETALNDAPEVKQAISQEQTNISSPNQNVTKVDEAKSYVDDKADGGTIQQGLKKAGTSVDSKEAQALADQYNLANVIQLNAQKKFPEDVITISAKQSGGTYSLLDISTGKTFVISVDGSGNITKMTEK